MKRQWLEGEMTSRFGALPEHLFRRYPSFAVFRHQENRKWFCVFMTIPREKLEPGREGVCNAVNFKCEEDLLDDLWQQEGIFPAYHMSKRHWITCLLDGSVPDEMLLFLSQRSFQLTK